MPILASRLDPFGDRDESEGDSPKKVAMNGSTSAHRSASEERNR